nr:phage portal protein [Enterococcus hirae]
MPTSDITWPPAQLDGISRRMAEWSAWYEGTPDALRAAYAGDRATAPTRPSQTRGGVVGAVARWWWGRPAADQAATRGQLHIPLAADLCQASADLLFAEPPTLTVDDTAAQDRLDVLAGDGLYATLAETAEIGAALGGSYLRVTWDQEIVPEGAFLTSVHADGAWPEFRWGRLVGVTFWRVIASDDRHVVRHLERHELDGAGIGIVLHGLYEGTRDQLGHAIPLIDHASTEGLAGLVDELGAISTLTPGLAVTYIPNQRPQRSWRTHPLGMNLGRSDLDGVEPLMDALDETWSSWMRDIRLGKGRIMAAQSLLESHGPGSGTTFDADREVFSPVNAPPDQSIESLVTASQFAIRVAEHQQTANELIQQILRTAGYSAATFGEGAEGMATATEVNAREQRSDLTRDRKIRHWRPGGSQILTKLLAVDAALGFPGAVRTDKPVQLEFGPSVQDSPLELAQTAQALSVAQAASTKTRVQLVHPDWDEPKVDEEVRLINAELAGAAVADPAALGAGGTGLDASFPAELGGAGQA